jgi:hypothetical protein
MAAFVARFEHPTEPERDEYRRHSTLCECFFPRRHGWFGFAIASANAAGTLVADVADIEMSRRPYGCYAGEGTTQNCSAFCPSRIDSVPLGNYRGRRPASRSSKLNRTASSNSGAVIAQDNRLAVGSGQR